MRTITKTIELYKFNELSEKVQEKVICEEIDFMIEIEVNCVYDTNGKVNRRYRNSGLLKAIKESEANRTPWFIGEYIWKYCEKQIMERLNNHEFTKSGEIYNDI